MESRYIIEGNAVYEVDDDCRAHKGKKQVKIEDERIELEEIVLSAYI